MISTLMAADIANDIYYLVTADNTGFGYETFTIYTKVPRASRAT